MDRRVGQRGARLARASDPPLVRGGVMPAAADHTVIVRKEPDLLDVRRVPTMPVALPGTPSSLMVRIGRALYSSIN